MNKSLPVCAFKAEILEILTDDKLFPKSFPLDEELQLEKVIFFFFINLSIFF